MDDLNELYVRLQKYTYYILAIFFLGWGFTSYQDVFLGLILGTILSLFNLRLLARRTVKLGDTVTAGGKTRTMGSFARMAIAVIGVAFVLKFPEQFHLISFVIGLMLCYALIMVDFFVQAFRSRR